MIHNKIRISVCFSYLCNNWRNIMNDGGGWVSWNFFLLNVVIEGFFVRCAYKNLVLKSVCGANVDKNILLSYSLN